MKNIVLAAAILLLTNPLRPEEKPDTLPSLQYFIKDIIIKAEKSDKSLIEIPAAVNIVSDVKLQQEHVVSLRDLSLRIPNFYMPDYGMRLSSPVYIRGIGAKINAPTVGLYVDGIPYFEKSAFDFVLLNIDKIEVLKGPQGTLYGRNTLGGLVNIETKEPDSIPGGTIISEGGNYGMKSMKLLMETPLIENRLFFSAAGSFYQRDGYTENTFFNKDIDSRQEYNSQLKLSYRNQRGYEGDLSFRYINNNDGGYPYARIDSVKKNPYEASMDHMAKYRRDLYAVSYRSEKDFGIYTLSSVTGFQRIDEFQDVDQDFSTVANYYVNRYLDQDLWTQEVNLSHSGEDYSLVTGVYGFYQKIHTDVDVVYADDLLARLNRESFHEWKRNQTKNYGLAFFTQNSFKNIFGFLDVTLGLRYDMENSDLDYRSYTYLNDTLTNTLNYPNDNQFRELLPKVGLSFRYSDNLRQYISFTRGYRPGGFNTTIDTDSLQQMPFDAEYNWNYETGFKAYCPHINSFFTLALFYIDWTDQQVYQPRPSGRGSLVKNAGKSYSMGGEFEFEFRPSTQLEFSGSVGYTNARFEDYTREDQVYDENRVPLAPEFTYNLNASRTWLFNGKSIPSFTFNASIQGVGDTYFNDENTLKQPHYMVLNAGLNLETAFGEFSLWGKNLLEEEYFSYMFDLTGTNGLGQLGAPLHFGISYRKDF